MRTLVEPSTVLITGGAGFIGAHVMRRLVEAEYEVRILDNMYRADPIVISEIERTPGVELVEADVRYRSSVERASVGIDSVIHLASVAINKSVVDPAESIEINVIGSENVFGVAADLGVRRVVFTSTASVYGEPDELPMREDGPLGPQTPYCLSKLAAEHLLGFYGRTRGLDWNVLRFFNVYGPGQRTDAYYTTVVNAFVERIMRGDSPIIDGSGEQSMDFIHVRDVARAVVLALESDVSKVVCNIGSGTQTSVADLARILIEATGSNVTPEFRPRDVLVTRREADITRAAELLAWKPEIELADGFAEVVAAMGAGR